MLVTLLRKPSFYIDPLAFVYTLQKCVEFILFYFYNLDTCLTKNILSEDHHIKLQVKEPPSGYCSHLLDHFSPKVQKPSLVIQVQSPPLESRPLTKL